VTLSLAHKILIGAAIAACAVLGVYEIYTYRKTGDAAALVLAAAAGVALVALAFYLRWFIRKVRRP
jgi:LPXTG-motif cell wall-anchored protein